MVGAMLSYPARYKFELLNAIQSLDLDKVNQVIEIFDEARTAGQRIFVCGRGADFAASQSLSEMVSNAPATGSSRFRILALSDQVSPRGGNYHPESHSDRVFVEQLKNVAEPDDVVLGISVSGNAPSVLHAIEYASWIGCKTIAVTGPEAGAVSLLADITIDVPVSHLASVEDAHLIICHMIGYYFVERTND